MNLYEFRDDFIQEVKATAENSKDSTTAAFVDVAANHLFNAEIISDYNPAFYIGTGKNNRKLRIDGYMLDEWDNSLTLIVAEYSGAEECDKINLADVKTAFSRVHSLIEEILFYDLKKQLEISLPIYDLAIELEDGYREKNLKKVRIILITDKTASIRTNTLDKTNFQSISVEYHIWDIDRFYKIAVSELGKQDIEIDFTEYTSQGLACIDACTSAECELKSYLCIIPGSVLADIYDEYGSLLLEGNVRSFLSVRGKVNKAIRATIIDKNRAPLFFCLNNGISVTADKVITENTPSGLYLRYVHNMQIVNGGQTTASLSNTRYKDKADLSTIYVQMKLTEVSKGKSEDLIPMISKSANSQNKVNEADFFSNHPFHIRIEDFSRRKYAPAVNGAQYETHWFYERARGQYTQMQMHKAKSEVTKFKLQNPKNQVITKTDIAKVINTWNGRPDIVSKGAQASFLYFANVIDAQWNKDDSVINEVYFQEAVGLFILFKHIERLVSNQDWYEGGYRANIVTYAIALFSVNLRRQYKNKKFNLLKFWMSQSIPDIITNLFVNITRIIFENITDEDRPIINVTQWCKREACWKQIKDIDIELPGIEEYLISIVELKEGKRKAKKEQKILNGIEAQIFVVNLGNDYWNDMLSWAGDLGLLSVEDKKLLALASRMSSTRMPNSVHCSKLQNLRNRMINEGFKTK